jgi:hypothetical protein
MCYNDDSASFIMLSVIVLSIIMLKLIIWRVIGLTVVMLNVIAPTGRLVNLKKDSVELKFAKL